MNGALREWHGCVVQICWTVFKRLLGKVIGWNDLQLLKAPLSFTINKEYWNYGAAETGRYGRKHIPVLYGDYTDRICAHLGTTARDLVRTNAQNSTSTSSRNWTSLAAGTVDSVHWRLPGRHGVSLKVGTFTKSLFGFSIPGLFCGTKKTRPWFGIWWHGFTAIPLMGKIPPNVQPFDMGPQAQTLDSCH
jgi:hypothetical protein